MTAAPHERPQPPSNIEAEQGLLGAILINNVAYKRVAGLVRPEHFANAVHGRMFAAIGKLIEAGALADIVMIKHALGDDPALVPIGGTAQYLTKLIASAVTVTNAEQYGRVIVETARRRALFDAGQRISEAASNPDAVLDDIVGRVVTELPQLVEGAGPANRPITRASDLADKPVPERPWLVPDWIPARQVTLLSGDGGIGKSLVAMQLQIAAAAARQWLGLPIVPCRSIGWYAEDEDDELHRRLVALAELMQVNIATLDRMAWRSVVADDAELIEPDEHGTVRPTPYLHQIERQALDFGAKLVVLDATTNFFGADEVKRRQVNSFLRLLRQFAFKIDGAVVLLAHPSLAGLSSGSGLSGSTHGNYIL